MNYSERFDMMENSTGNGSDVVISRGGKFSFSSYAGGGSYGTLKLQQKDPQGNYLDVASASHSADGVLMVEISSGTYRVVATTVTAVYSYLIRF